MECEGFATSPPRPNDLFWSGKLVSDCAGCRPIFELNEAKSRTAASGSIGEIMNQLRHYSPMHLEPISILDRLITFVQEDE